MKLQYNLLDWISGYFDKRMGFSGVDWIFQYKSTSFSEYILKRMAFQRKDGTQSRRLDCLCMRHMSAFQAFAKTTGID